MIEVPAVHGPYLLLTALLLFLVVFGFWPHTNRHSIDIRGAAISAGTSAALRGQMPNVPDHLKQKYAEIAQQQTHSGKARAAGKTVFRAGLAKVASLLSLICLVSAAIAIAAALFWK